MTGKSVIPCISPGITPQLFYSIRFISLRIIMRSVSFWDSYLQSVYTKNWNNILNFFDRVEDWQWISKIQHFGKEAMVPNPIAHLWHGCPFKSRFEIQQRSNHNNSFKLKIELTRKMFLNTFGNCSNVKCGLLSFVSSPTWDREGRLEGDTVTGIVPVFWSQSMYRRPPSILLLK